MMIKDKIQYLALVFLVLCYEGHTQSFYFGADLSYINEMQDCGAEYNVSNVPTDPFEILSDHGVNLARFRLWHTPAWYDNLNAGDRYSDFADVHHSIMRAKEQGMDVQLDFHLSDTWADPSHQVAPLAWSAVLNNLPVLQDSLYNYIYATLDRLASDDLLPEIVQIGNETNKGILLSQATNDSGWVMDWDRNSALFNTAIDAIRDIEAIYQEEIKIAIHIADPSDVEWYIGQFTDHGVVDFDVIGISYYYQWHEQLFAEVGNIIAALRGDYPGKEVMIFETAYPWTSFNADGANNLLSVPYPGYAPFTPQSQLQWLTTLTQEVIDAGGSGLIYWEPGWVSTSCETQFASGSSWDNATFFDADHTLIENGGIGWASQEYNFPTGVNIINNASDMKVYQDGEQLHISLSENHTTNNTVFIGLKNIDGRELLLNKIGSIAGNIVLDVTDIVPGIYFVSVGEKNNVVTEKVFIH